MVNMGVITKTVAGSADDILRAIYTRIDDFAASAAKKAAMEVPKIPGQAVALGTKVTNKVVPFITAHPTLTASLASAAAAGLIVTALQQDGSVTSGVDPRAFNIPYEDPIAGTTTQGEVTDPSKTTAKKDYGIIGNALGITGTTLFGEAGTDAANFVEGAKPWLLGAGVIVAMVAVGYTVSSLRGNRQTVRFESGMSQARQ
jgi:hypothetical protein